MGNEKFTKFKNIEKEFVKNFIKIQEFSKNITQIYLGNLKIKTENDTKIWGKEKGKPISSDFSQDKTKCMGKIELKERNEKIALNMIQEMNSDGSHKSELDSMRDSFKADISVNENLQINSQI